MKNRTKKAFKNLYEYLFLHSIGAAKELHTIELALNQSRKDTIKEIIKLVEELSSDPPLESNERRRGYHKFADDIIFNLK